MCVFLLIVIDLSYVIGEGLSMSEWHKGRGKEEKFEISVHGKWLTEARAEGI